MDKKKSLSEHLVFKIIILLLVAFALAPITIYLIHFTGRGLSDNNIDWSQFGTFLSGTLSPVIALTGAVLTFTIGFVSYRHNQTLLEKQIRDKRPLLNVSYGDFENEISIKLYNRGLGPLIITRYQISNSLTGKTKNSIYGWIKSVPCEFGNYTSDFTDVVIAEGGCRELLMLEGDPQDADFTNNRNRIRKILGDLSFNIEYKDIYDTQMSPCVKSLQWFKRLSNELDAT